MIFKNILLAYQLEGYNSLRFLRFIYSHPKFCFLGSPRQVLDWTSKAKLIYLISIILFICSILGCIFFMDIPFVILGLFVCLFSIPFYSILATLILSPLDIFLKKRIIYQAKKKLTHYPNLKIIAITGSYGKTTTKEILATILSESFKVLATQGTKNTPLGISQLILDNLNESHEILIVEMGAYHRGNIAELCSITKPNISIITGITLQHLERFKNLDTIIDAKFEILQCLNIDDYAIVDMSTEGVKKGLETKSFQVKTIEKIFKNSPYIYKNNLEGIIFDIDGEKVETKLLANYIGKTLQICKKVSEKLGQNTLEFKKGVSKIEFVEHRMQLIYNPVGNVYILDDSFNGNIEGIGAIVDFMKEAPFFGRKILIAGGIVELGEETERVHKELAIQMGEVSDMILLVEGEVGNALKIGLLESQYPAASIKIYKTPSLLHADLKNIIKNGDLVIFQNDLPDHYL